MPKPTTRRVEVRTKVVTEVDRLNALPQHNYVAGTGDLCMTCAQIQLHPLHGVFEDALPESMKLVKPMVGDPSYQKAAYTGDGCMVALYPGSVEKLGVEVQGGGDFPVEDPRDWHVTVAYLPETPEGDELQRLSELVNQVATVFEPLTGVWGGTARFNPSTGSDGKPVLVALPDLPGLPELHHFVRTVLDAAGYEVARNHGYQPHMTIAYDDNGRVRAEGPLRFTELVLKTKDQRFSFEFGGQGEAEKAALLREVAAVKVKCLTCDQEYFADSVDEIEAHKASHAEQVEAEASGQAPPATTSERTPALPDEPLPATKAFLTEAYGKTLLTAPASTFVPTWEKALTPNQHFLWMQGRFVGAEKANRNGAFWSTADLEMGAPTVNHGPVNWLHEAHHVIGTIADSKLVLPTSETAGEGFQEPHIVAAAAIWRWIFPDEAFVMEEASDQGKLWYSMECVSREVSCEGPNGCGAVVPYMDAISNSPDVCSHVRERSSIRRFVDPTFLGGAVIVPPVRPGWADADAKVMREAAAQAEKAYDAAGHPDLTASEWEGLMAQVIGFASS